MWGPKYEHKLKLLTHKGNQYRSGFHWLLSLLLEIYKNRTIRRIEFNIKSVHCFTCLARHEQPTKDISLSLCFSVISVVNIFRKTSGHYWTKHSSNSLQLPVCFICTSIIVRTWERARHSGLVTSRLWSITPRLTISSVHPASDRLTSKIMTSTVVLLQPTNF